MKMSADRYGQFLLSSQGNYPGTHWGGHLDGLTHDNGQCFLTKQHVTSRQRRHPVRAGAVLRERGYVNPETGQCWRIDCRIFAPGADGCTKRDHVAQLLTNQKIFYGPLKTRFKRLGATAWPTIPAANGPTDPSGAWPGRTRTRRRAQPGRAGPRTRIRSGNCSAYGCPPTRRTTSSPTSWHKTTRPPKQNGAFAGRVRNFTAKPSNSPATKPGSAGWPAAGATAAGWPCGPGPGSNRWPTAAIRRFINQRKTCLPRTGDRNWPAQHPPLRNS